MAPWGGRGSPTNAYQKWKELLGAQQTEQSMQMVELMEEALDGLDEAERDAEENEAAAAASGGRDEDDDERHGRAVAHAGLSALSRRS